MSETLIHLWNHCHHCGAKPITGKRYHCETCPDGPDNDLCAACYRLFGEGRVKHPPQTGFHTLPDTGNHRFTEWEGQSAAAYDRWIDVAMPEVGPPSVKDGFLIRPEFCSGYESTFGGYGFVVATRRGSLVLTALHVMDEMIKKKKIDSSGENPVYTGKELPAAISRVNLYDVLQDKWMLYTLGEAGPMLALPNARTGDEEPFSDRDIAAFWVKDTAGIDPGRLADTPPDVGDPIWLAAKVAGGNRTLAAVVVERSDRVLAFRYADPADGPKYTSGAPILDQNGHVVGINVGGGFYNGYRFGHANHVTNIRRHLAEGET